MTFPSPKDRAIFVGTAVLRLAILLAGLVLGFLSIRAGILHWGQVGAWARAFHCAIWPGFLAGIGILALRLRPGHLLELAAGAVVTLVGLYGLETFLGHWINRDPLMQAARVQGAEWDSRSQARVWEDLRMKNPRVYLHMAPTYWAMRGWLDLDGRRIVPFSNPARATILCHNENGYFMTYDTDELGFPNPVGAWDRRSLDVAVVGDSFAQGAAVREGERMIDRVRAKHPATLNLAAGGNGPLVELATIKEYLAEFRPRTVLWCYFEGNDLVDLEKEAGLPVIRDYLGNDRGQRLREDHATVDRLLRQRQEQFFRDRHQPSRRNWLHLHQLRKALRLGPRQPKFVPNLELYEQALREGRDCAARWNGRLVLVYLPCWYRYARRGNGGPEDARSEACVAAHPEIRRLADRLAIPVIDLADGFAASRDPLEFFPFRQNGHYNARGHQFAGRAICGFLDEATEKKRAPSPHK